MTTRFARRWKSFWDEQTLPLHRRDNDEHYAALSRELQLLFPETQPSRVLEIGCGNGALYDHLGFNQAEQYVGIDLSESMLATFRQRYPERTLVVASGETYSDDNQYDLIFSNGVLQYFDRSMLTAHFERAAHMLSPNGIFVCGSVPWRRLRTAYLLGRIHRARMSPVRFAYQYARTYLPDSMGRWFDWRELEKAGQQHGFTAEFYGSLHYAYRFHVVYRPAAAAQPRLKAAA